MRGLIKTDPTGVWRDLPERAVEEDFGKGCRRGFCDGCVRGLCERVDEVLERGLWGVVVREGGKEGERM